MCCWMCFICVGDGGRGNGVVAVAPALVNRSKLLRGECRSVLARVTQMGHSVDLVWLPLLTTSKGQVSKPCSIVVYFAKRNLRPIADQIPAFGLLPPLHTTGHDCCDTASHVKTLPVITHLEARSGPRPLFGNSLTSI